MLSGTLPFSNGSSLGKRIVGIKVIYAEDVAVHDPVDMTIRLNEVKPLGTWRFVTVYMSEPERFGTWIVFGCGGVMLFEIIKSKLKIPTNIFCIINHI